MTTPSSSPDGAPSMNLRGAVDLSGLKKNNSTAPTAPSAPGGPGAGGPGSGAGGAVKPGSTSGNRFILNVTEESFGQVVQLSQQVPVVVDLGSSRSDASVQLSGVLEKLAVEYNGKILLAHVDADASAQIAQAFQVQSVPAVVAVLKGQPVPLFEGAQPEEQIRSFLEELLKVAEANGVTGTLDGEEGEQEEAEKPLPPLHQEAYDAIEAGDYAAASAAYQKALAEQPADAEAKAGLAQVQLMQRVQDMDGNKVRQEAADAPDSVPAQLAVADLDVVGGHVEDAFSRLVKLVGRTAGDERETVRARMVELFDVVGNSDPRVSKARSALARALF